jgi:hypothetical protein
MNDLLDFPNGTDTTLAQVVAREDYFRLRDTLVALQSESEPNAAAIEGVIRALERAQLAYKATHGLIGNNPIGDSPNT